VRRDTTPEIILYIINGNIVTESAINKSNLKRSGLLVVSDMKKL
jgi:hypothetical protein